MSKFKLGDKVFDVNYGIVEVTDESAISVRLETIPDKLFFYRLLDGRPHSESPVPFLYTIEEARKLWPDAKCLQKKKVKKKINGFVQIDESGMVDSFIFGSREEALMHAEDNVISVAEISGEYEIEE